MAFATKLLRVFVYPYFFVAEKIRHHVLGIQISPQSSLYHYENFSIVRSIRRINRLTSF